MTIRELRQQAGLTQKEFSVLFGIPKRTIEDWERGVRTPAPYLVSLIEFKLRALEPVLREAKYGCYNDLLGYIESVKEKYEKRGHGMSRYIDREALLEWIEAVDGCLADGTVEAPTLYAQIITDIQQFPPPIVDVVEVVRCKDCAYYRDETSCCLNPHCVVYYYGHRVREDHYCSYGERSEE